MTRTPRLLIVDDDASMIAEFMRLAVPAGLADFEIDTAESPTIAVDLLRSGQRYEVVLLDLHFGSHPSDSLAGFEVLPEMRRMMPDAHIVIYSGDDHPSTIAKARELGASGVFAKHHYTFEDIAWKVRSALARRSSRQSAQDQGRALASAVGAVFVSEAMTSVYTLAASVKSIGTGHVLITGPTGSGKDLVARAIGQGSKVFVPINCAALPDSLIESEFFGHEKGSFTGAIAGKKGIFEQADGGILFLDEVGTLSRKGQEALLRVLQSGEFKRVGGHESIKVDVRVVAATNEDLKAKIADGVFREDVYERLSGYSLEVPGLAQRTEDIEPLIAFFIKTSRKQHLRLDPTCKAWLEKYSWPRNVRQLKNVVEQMIDNCVSDELEISDIPAVLFMDAAKLSLEKKEGDSASSKGGEFTFSSQFGAPLDDVIAACTVAYINQTAARLGTTLTIRGLADALQIPYASLHRRLIKHGLSVDKRISGFPKKSD